MQDQSMVKEIIESFKYDGNKAINFLKSEYTVT